MTPDPEDIRSIPKAEQARLAIQKPDCGIRETTAEPMFRDRSCRPKISQQLLSGLKVAGRKQYSVPVRLERCSTHAPLHGTPPR